MNQELSRLTDWLEQCKGQALVIEKLEQGDQDLTQLQLEQVSCAQHPSSRDDDYIAPYELVLHGQGIILNENQAALPGNQYEIPLLGDWRGSLQENTLHLTTDRAEYTIKRS